EPDVLLRVASAEREVAAHPEAVLHSGELRGPDRAGRLPGTVTFVIVAEFELDRVNRVLTTVRHRVLVSPDTACDRFTLPGSDRADLEGRLRLTVVGGAVLLRLISRRRER